MSEDKNLPPNLASSRAFLKDISQVFKARKWHILITMCVLLIGISVGTSFNKSSNEAVMLERSNDAVDEVSQSSNSQTLEDKSFGYKFEYPLSWKSIEPSEYLDREIPRVGTTISALGDESGQFTFFVMAKNVNPKSTGRLFFEDFIDTLVPDPTPAFSQTGFSVKLVNEWPYVKDYVTSKPTNYLDFDAPSNINVARMKISENSNLDAVSWSETNLQPKWSFSGGDGIKTLYARFEDQTGKRYDISQEFKLDTLPPIGGIALSNPVIGPDIVKTTIWTSAEDNLSGVS